MTTDLIHVVSNYPAVVHYPKEKIKRKLRLRLNPKVQCQYKYSTQVNLGYQRPKAELKQDPEKLKDHYGNHCTSALIYPRNAKEPKEKKPRSYTDPCKLKEIFEEKKWTYPTLAIVVRVYQVATVDPYHVEINGSNVIYYLYTYLPYAVHNEFKYEFDHSDHDDAEEVRVHVNFVTITPNDLEYNEHIYNKVHPLTS